MPETIFVASVKSAVYANGFYVAPHHSSVVLGERYLNHILRSKQVHRIQPSVLQMIEVMYDMKRYNNNTSVGWSMLTTGHTDIRVLAFRSGQAVGSERSEHPRAKFCVSVNSATLCHKVKPVDAFVLDNSDRLTQPGVNLATGCHYAEPLEEISASSFSLPHIDSMHYSGSDRPYMSSFLGLTVGDEGEVILVIPDGTCAPKSVTSASCEVLAQSLGWKVERRPVSFLVSE